VQSKFIISRHSRSGKTLGEVMGLILCEACLDWEIKDWETCSVLLCETHEMNMPQADMLLNMGLFSWELGMYAEVGKTQSFSELGQKVVLSCRDRPCQIALSFSNSTVLSHYTITLKQ
jgi:hypothetical protein